jgi:hypothetical protein
LKFLNLGHLNIIKLRSTIKILKHFVSINILKTIIYVISKANVDCMLHAFAQKSQHATGHSSLDTVREDERQLDETEGHVTAC